MTEPQEFLERTILVDSTYESRQKVLRDIRKAAISKMVVEAPSVIDGLRSIECGGIEVCFLGPSLSAPASRHLMRVARNLPTAQNCAFVALDQSGVSNFAALKDEIHVDETIEFPFIGNNFRTIVKQATNRFKSNMSSSYKLSTPPFSLTSEYVKRPLTAIVKDISLGLQNIASQVEQKQATGKLSKEEFDTLYDKLTALYRDAFLPNTGLIKEGSYDHLFINFLADWFSDSCWIGQAQATDILKAKLLSQLTNKDS